MHFGNIQETHYDNTESSNKVYLPGKIFAVRQVFYWVLAVLVELLHSHRPAVAWAVEGADVKPTTCHQNHVISDLYL